MTEDRGPVGVRLWSTVIPTPHIILTLGAAIEKH